MASSTRTGRRGEGDGRWTRRTERLAEAYFHWLVEQVREEGTVHQRKTYWDLLRLMHSKEFVWMPESGNDDNRIEDGKDLRVEFFHDNGVDGDKEMFGPASVLEVLIGVSRRLAWSAGDGAEGWAFELLRNLKLDKMTDPLSPIRARKADDIMETLIWRNYDPDGCGGFFPLAWPSKDQRRVEIWYQMQEYIGEIHPEYRKEV
jgi:hypothetical protein